MPDTIDGSTTNPPEGWSYDAPDPSLGLSGGWYHETCQWPDDDEAAQVALELAGGEEKNGRAYSLYALHCACGESVTVAEEVW